MRNRYRREIDIKGTVGCAQGALSERMEIRKDSSDQEDGRLA